MTDPQPINTGGLFTLDLSNLDEMDELAWTVPVGGLDDPRTISSLPGAPYLAVDVQPDYGDTDTLVLDLSEVDGPDVLGWSGEALGWVNIVCDVTRVSIRRGSTRTQGVLTRAEAGECTVAINDTGRLFDPMVNSDAIHAGTPVRIRAWGFQGQDMTGWEAVLFTGTITDVPATYPKTGPPQVTLHATDLIGDLAAYKAAGRAEPGVGAGENLRDRVQRVLGETGLGAAPISDPDTVFAAALAPSTLTSGWDEISDATDAELGQVWVDALNRLVVRGRESLLSGPVRGTLSDLHGEAADGLGPHCCYDDVSVAQGGELVANRVVAARRVPGTSNGTSPPASAVVQVDNLESQAWLRRVTGLERRDLELATDAQLQPWAESVVVTGSRPQVRVDTISPSPAPADLDSALAAWPAVCATDLGDRWALRYHPEQGPTLDLGVGVLGIALDLTPDVWDVTWQLTSAPLPGAANPQGWVALDVSELDGGDVLAPYGGAVLAAA